jgi:uncharacterized protein YodC (DUF2158 family)
MPDEVLDIEVGAICVLKSGGPLMTITAITVTECECSWFSAGDLEIASFAPICLRLPLESEL